MVSATNLEFQACHVFRESNTVTDLLVKFENESQDRFAIYCNLPPFPLLAFNNNMIGTWYHRNVITDYFALTEGLFVCSSPPPSK